MLNYQERYETVKRLSSEGKVVIERVGEKWELYGATYDHRTLLMRAGCEWKPERRAWMYAGEELPEVLRDLATAPVPTPAPEASPEPEAEPEAEEEAPQPEQPVLNPPDGVIAPSYWNDLIQYLTPGDCRPAIALVGPAGNGKTTIAEAACTALNLPYVVIDATEYLEPADLIGSMTYDPTRGEVWRDGLVTRAFRDGHAIIINEFDALNPRAALCLQSVCQDAGANRRGRYVTTPGAAEHDRVYPVGDCPVLVTMNTYGTGATRQYVGRNALDAATADRFTIISTGYENEQAILLARGYQKRLSTRLVRWSTRVREQIDKENLRVVLSMRTLLRIAQAVQRYGWTFEKAIEKEFFARLEPETRSLLL